MKRNINKKLLTKIGIILLNLFMLVSLILILGFKINYGYSMYWVITPFLMVLVLSVIQKWSVRGLNADIDESKTIQRSFDDTTTLSTVFFGLIYLLIQGIEFWKENITDNQVIIIGFFIIMIVYELFTYLSIYNTKKETAKLLEKKYNNRK